MAGIVAYFGSDHTALSDLSNGLAARGHDTATWREGHVGLAIRAALPMIHTGHGLAAAVDGVTETTRLLNDYAERGAKALVRAGEPYAIAVADPDRETLLLARSGDGPTLYYAAVGGTLLAAAEPAALIAAGVPANPDPETISHFVETGECDHTEATFYSGIRRLLPGQVAEVTRRGLMKVGVRVGLVPAGQARPALSLPVAVAEAVRHGRVGVRLAGTPDDDDLLTAALAHPAVRRPLPAYQPAFGEPVTTVTDGQVRHHPVPVGPDQLLADLPAFLADLGEPVPDLADYLRWACARASMGEVDTLLDAGSGYHLSRLADRIAARFGVGVRYACQPGAGDPAPLGDLLHRIKDRVYGTFLTEEFASRPWVDASGALAAFDSFVSGRGRHDPGWFWRLFLVEQWLRLVVEAGREIVEPASRDPFAPHPDKELAIAVDGKRWLRFCVRTHRFGPGDPLPRQVAGYVAELVAEARAHPRFRDVFGKPWYVAVAEKVVAVAQRRSYLLWEIRPGWWARTLARLLTRTPWGVGPRSAWTMQLAIREAGLPRILLATLAGLVGRLVRRPHWYDVVAGRHAAAIDGPADHSMYPANLSATLGAAEPERVAHEIEAALRLTLPDDAAEQLRGCVVLDARDSGARVRGSSADRSDRFFEEAFADNPFGQGGEQTPVAVMVSAAAVRRPKRSSARPRRRQPAPSPR